MFYDTSFQASTSHDYCNVISLVSKILEKNQEVFGPPSSPSQQVFGGPNPYSQGMTGRLGFRLL